MYHPSLDDLAAFVAVAESRNFRQAARLRSVSPSSLSDAVRRLEAGLGVRLFNRTTRSVTLTEAGERLLADVQPCLAGIDAAVEQVGSTDQQPSGRLRLNVPGIVARCILPDIACRFLDIYPNVVLDVSSNDAFVDVLAEGFDAGVRYEEALHQDMIAIPIGPSVQCAMSAASPEYLMRYGMPSKPADVMEHRCIRHKFDSGRLVPWSYMDAGREVSLHPPAALIAGNTEIECAAAIAGIGIIHTFEEFLKSGLEAGTLVPILEEYTLNFSGPFLYYPSRKLMPLPLRAFVDFVKAENKGRQV